jgi:hypothetical protein
VAFRLGSRREKEEIVKGGAVRFLDVQTIRYLGRKFPTNKLCFRKLGGSAKINVNLMIFQTKSAEHTTFELTV